LSKKTGSSTFWPLIKKYRSKNIKTATIDSKNNGIMIIPPIMIRSRYDTSARVSNSNIIEGVF
jgi:hypothetical protein